MEMRQALEDKEDQKTLKQKTRERVSCLTPLPTHTCVGRRSLLPIPLPNPALP